MLRSRPYNAEFCRAEIVDQCANVIKYSLFGKCCNLNSVIFNAISCSNVRFEWNVSVHSKKVYLSADKKLF